MNKNKWLWTILFFLIAVLSISTVMISCKSFDLSALVFEIRYCNKLLLFCALGGMTGFIFFEGLAIKVIVDALAESDEGKLNKKDRKIPPSPSGEKNRKCPKVKGTGYIYAASDIYFSAITPSATGGQPASLFFMVKDGIPATVATVALLVNLVMYSLALMVIGAFCAFFFPDLFGLMPIPAKLLILAGYLSMFFLTVVFILLLVKERIIYQIALWGLNLLEKLHLLHQREKYEKKLVDLLVEYRQCSDQIKGKHGMLCKAFICNVLQRASQISVTMFCYLSIGGELDNAARLFCVQGILAVGANSVPVPGSMGVSDYLLVQGLSSIQAVSHAANLELFSRGISFYLCTVICGISVIYAYFKRKTKRSL